MTHTLAAQIQIIQHARTIIDKFEAIPIELRKSINAGLNDAGSTIAALNLNPDREKIALTHLANVLKIIEDGFLVRDISKDHLPDWAIRLVKPMSDLGAAAKYVSENPLNQKSEL